MITSTSLLHPNTQIKIQSARVQAQMGLVGKVYNRKGQVIMVCVKHGAFEDYQDPTFYAVYEDGSVGKDVTEMVLKACPYSMPVVKKSFFQKVITKVVDKAVSVYENVATNAAGYVAGITPSNSLFLLRITSCSLQSFTYPSASPTQTATTTNHKHGRLIL